MRTAKAIAQSLLDVDREKNRALAPNAKGFAFVLAILNLLPGGLSENYLRDDTTGYYLSLYLFCHAALYFLLSLVYFTGSSREIMEKTRVFPTNSLGRLLFAFVANLRHPFSIGLLVSNMFFFIVLFRTSLETAGILAVSYLLLMISIAAVAAFVFLFLEKRRMPAHAALVIATLLATISLVLTVVFHVGSTSLIFGPLIDLIVQGILSSARGDFVQSATGLVGLGSTIAVTFIAGKRLT